MREAVSSSWNSMVTDHMAIRLWLMRVLYGLALGGMSVGTLGLAGLIPGVYFLLTWAVVFFSRARVIVLVMMCLLGLPFFFFALPLMGTPTELARRTVCQDNLKHIALALHSYHDEYGQFPPARILDEKGTPMHSWRVLLLPFLDRPRLYNRYDFDEPWNGPNNRILMSHRPEVYGCPSRSKQAPQAETYASYVAVIGPHTAWPGAVGRKLADISDPAGGTILLVEATGEGIPWTEPQDLTVAEALDILTSVTPERAGGHRAETFFTVKFSGRHVAMADGSVHFIRSGTPRKAWAQLLTIDDGAVWPEEAPRTDVPYKVKVGNCIRFSIWIGIILFPLPWVFVGKRNCKGRFFGISRIASPRGDDSAGGSSVGESGRTSGAG